MPQIAKLFLNSLVIYGLLAGCPSGLHGMEGPDSVDLASLVNIYGEVSFDHVMHAEAVGCAVCHHHTTGDAVEDGSCLPCHGESGASDEVACSSCHSGGLENTWFRLETGHSGGVFHLERTGLKRAYHLKCLGCHQETGAASGCEDCHQKLERGRASDQAGPG